MPTFASDYFGNRMSTTAIAPSGYRPKDVYNGGGGGGSWGAQPAQQPYGPSSASVALDPRTAAWGAPMMAYNLATQTPSAPSVPGTGQQSYLASAIKTKAPQPPTAPQAPQYDFSQDAQKGSAAMALAQQIAAMNAKAVAGGSFQVQPAGTGVSASTMPTYGPNQNPDGSYKVQSNADKLAAYTPESVQGQFGGNEYSTTSAGLQPPDPADYTTPDAYSKAQETFAQLSLMEQTSEANSAARQFSDARNAEQAATDEMRRRVQAATTAQQEIARKNAGERTLLANQLASRGLDPNTDTWALGEVRKLDALDREEQQAAATMASIDSSTLRSQANDAARERLSKRIAEIATQKKAFTDSLATETKANTDMLLAQATSEKDKATAEKTRADIRIADRETTLKENLNPTVMELNQAKTAGLITDAEYKAGVETANKQAQTDKLAAETGIMLDLAPLQKKKLQAEVTKAFSSGSSAGTESALTKRFYTDASSMVDDMAAGKREWGSAYNTMKIKYPEITSDTLYTVLDKDKWSKPRAWQENIKDSNTSKSQDPVSSTKELFNSTE